MPAVDSAYSDAEIEAVANDLTLSFDSNGSQLTARELAELKKQTPE